MKRLKLAIVSFLLIAFGIGGYVVGASTYKNYFAPAAVGSLDNVLYIGGTAHVLSGGTLTIDAGGLLDVNGTLNADTVDMAAKLTVVNVDVSGTLDADTLDVDGVCDIDGTLNADTVDFSKKLTVLNVDVSGTLDADTVDIDGVCDVDGTLNADTVDIANKVTVVNVDVSGTLDADTLDLDGAADFASTVTAHMGITQSAGNSLGNTPYTAKIDTTIAQINDTTAVPGSTLVYTIPDTGGAIHVVCGGTVNTDDQGTKELAILGGTTVVTALTIAQNDDGDYVYEAWVTAMSGTTVLAGSKIGLSAHAGTLFADTNVAGTTLDISAVTTWTVQMDLAHADDEMSIHWCIWEVRPY